LDKKPVDSMERRKTWIVAMDALNKPSEEQYETKFLLKVCVPVSTLKVQMLLFYLVYLLLSSCML
jgi:hypothetical protein